MIKIRKSSDRGLHREDWLTSYHTFSFHTYYDPAFMGFRDLRVINEDRVVGGQGFGLHPHENMEIISLVLEGVLEHRDNLGNREAIHAYELQRITAGTGIFHSEINPLPDKAVHFLQIWIIPRKQGLRPSYEIRKFPDRPFNKLITLASPEPGENSAQIQQDVTLYFGAFQKEHELDYPVDVNRHLWVQVISGSLADSKNGGILSEGDGAAISQESNIALQALEDSEFLLFDLE